MEESSLYYAKLQSMNAFPDVYVKHMPCVLGRSPTSEPISQFQSELYPDLEQLETAHRLTLTCCPCIGKCHAILRYDKAREHYEIKALYPFYHNHVLKTPNDGFFPLTGFDSICFQCVNQSSHAYHFILPQKPKPRSARYKPAKKLMVTKWINEDREALKKLLMIHGYGRWEQIRNPPGGEELLQDKGDVELIAYSNAFIKCLVEYLNFENSDLKKVLLDMLEPEQSISVPAKVKDWGELLKLKALAWGRRILLLHQVKIIMEIYNKQQTKQKGYDNLLNILPNSAFYGERPSIWWTKRHDIDLLVGTYKYGYADYPLMREDPQLSLQKLENKSVFQEFPEAYTITRRLKNLVLAILKEQPNLTKLTFEKSGGTKRESTGWTLREKQHIVNLVTDYGVTTTNEGKSDWVHLREKLLERIASDMEADPKVAEEKGPQQLEKFVQRLRIHVYQFLENPKEKFDPDQDGFSLSYDQAQTLYKNVNMLQYIRKHILGGANTKVFQGGLTKLEWELENSKEEANLPLKWSPKKHDKGLLVALAQNGFSFLKKLSGNSQYGFEDIEIKEKDGLKRLEYLCKFYQELSSGPKVCKKRKAPEKTEPPTEAEPKPTVETIRRDSKGNVVYPVAVSPSLTVLELGTIGKESRTERCVYPIGYKAIREHMSVKDSGKKAKYLCEIMEKGTKLLFEVKPLEDLEHPIHGTTATEAWRAVNEKVNELKGRKEEMIVISGPERFGLSDPVVMELIKTLIEKVGQLLLTF
eukprot:TRINITY_DN1581_c0_g1_i1.p1 TRINITY_DN1581_c0_g1~~TRINITY_DN1581_c0_g1_i1.p1  ORF type:complete len:782 (-),score=65.59 TRINITY_DN1581_c0_g1_i1:72-2336(-)